MWMCEDVIWYVRRWQVESNTGCIAIVTCSVVGFRLTSFLSAVRVQIPGQGYHNCGVKHKLVLYLSGVTPGSELLPNVMSYAHRWQDQNHQEAWLQERLLQHQSPTCVGTKQSGTPGSSSGRPLALRHSARLPRPARPTAAWTGGCWSQRRWQRPGLHAATRCCPRSPGPLTAMHVLPPGGWAARSASAGVKAGAPAMRASAPRHFCGSEARQQSPGLFIMFIPGLLLLHRYSTAG